jgi:hypothetical protein
LEKIKKLTVNLTRYAKLRYKVGITQLNLSLQVRQGEETKMEKLTSQHVSSFSKFHISKNQFNNKKIDKSKRLNKENNVIVSQKLKAKIVEA